MPSTSICPPDCVVTYFGPETDFSCVMRFEVSPGWLGVNDEWYVAQMVFT